MNRVQIYNDENSDEGSVLLKPNETAVYTKNDSKFLVSKIASTREQLEQTIVNKGEYLQSKTIASVISWKDCQLIFENESFSELSTRLERWYDVDIEVTDSTILTENSYTGKFVHNESLDQVLKIISRTTPIKYTIIDGNVIIQKNDK
ncbi:MAG TPA: DUF4974 domain-containing protein [Bacteroidales bacterium]|nr:DUF4974 domain-containing protein [Bacteroidales bacterium]